MVTATKIQPAPELLRAKTTISYAVETLHRLAEWAHEAERIDPGRYGELIDHLKAADRPDESGTPVAILAAIGALLEPCPGCDREGRDVRQQPDGDLVCARCGRMVSSAEDDR